MRQLNKISNREKMRQRGKQGVTLLLNKLQEKEWGGLGLKQARSTNFWPKF